MKLAQHILMGTEVAMKVLLKGKQGSALITSKIMKAVEHPNVVQLFEVTELPRNVCLIMEQMSGDSCCCTF